MLSTIEANTTELPLDTAAKRALIRSELRQDAGRSDREIGRVCGVDGKTVSAVRAKMVPSAEKIPQTPTPTEPRHMLIEACKDFDAKRVVTLVPKNDDSDDHGEPLFRRQGEVYVHMNKFGELVILEKSWPDEDHWICIPRQNVPVLIQRIQQVIAEWDGDRQ